MLDHFWEMLGLGRVEGPEEEELCVCVCGAGGGGGRNWKMERSRKEALMMTTAGQCTEIKSQPPDTVVCETAIACSAT